MPEILVESGEPLLSFDEFVELLSPIASQLSEIFGGEIPWRALWWAEEFRAGAPYWDEDLESFCGGPESLVEWMERGADGKPPIPKWILNATAPDFHAELQRFRLDIDKHRLAPAEHARKRLDAYRFLAGHVVRSPGPWQTRRWQALRRLVPDDPRERARSLRELFAVFSTAQYERDKDLASHDRLQCAAAVYPSRREIQRLLKAAPGVKALLAAVPAERRRDFLRIHVREFTFETSSGERLSGWIQLGDLIGDPPQLAPGWGRPRAEFDSPMDLLMRYFVDSLGLPVATAAALTADVYEWFLGIPRSADALRKKWLWLRAHPEKTPPQP